MAGHFDIEPPQLSVSKSDFSMKSEDQTAKKEMERSIKKKSDFI
jgi:hypothetical protein